MSESFPADILRSELQREGTFTPLADGPPDADEATWQAMLSMALESDFVDVDVARDADFVLARWPRQSDSLRLAMMSAALRGLALRRGAALPKTEVHQRLTDLRQDVAGDLAEDHNAYGDFAVAERELQEFDALLSALSDGTASVSHFSESDFAFWISDFQLPEELLFAAVHPGSSHEEAAAGDSSQYFSVLRGDVRAWDSFRERVREQVRARTRVSGEAEADT